MKLNCNSIDLFKQVRKIANNPHLWNFTVGLEQTQDLGILEFSKNFTVFFVYS